ncbi:large ribosomal subunit protein eL34-like [Desmodus rotundus]|uniref:large ribosomal subunit protein eL34-like n=1 Tax=Desmodus rotundus TaxID=9430 RepID=UPI001E1BEB0A|nr:60S ribosomal protein L34-like [Desmodus rotundus]
MVRHLTCPWRLPYHAASNQARLPQASGDSIVCLDTKKVGKAPKSACRVCPGRLQGVLMGLSKPKKHVSAACGGSVCAKPIHHRPKHALLTEEQKIVVEVLKARAQNPKAK